MSLRSLQPRRNALARAAAILLVAAGLGACQSRGPDATGSLGGSATQLPASPDALRKASASYAERYDSDPGDIANAIAYARTLRALDQTAQAVAVLQTTAIRNPQNLEVLGAYGKALADSGRLKEAAEVLPKAHRPDRPDWRILNVQGAVADQLGDFEAAQRFYEAALKIVPGEPAILTNQGLSYALARKLPQAEAILRMAANDPRADRRSRQNLALVLGLEGRFGEAEAILKQDLAPAEVAASLASMKKMVSQPNSWKAIRQADSAGGARG